MLFSMGGKEGIALAMKNGLFFTHTPVLNKALLTATVISGAFFGFAYFYLRQREQVREYLFASALLGGCWIAFNEQVITGREVWYPHFMQYTVPLGVAAIMITGYFAFRHLKYLWAVCVGVLCSICIVYGLYAVTAYTAPWDLDRLIQLQSAATYATWLDENTPKDCVVLANPNDTDLYDEERLIPTFSHCNTYTVDFVPFGITSERVEHNYLLQLRMRDIGANDIRTYLMGQEGWIRGLFPSDWHQTFGHGMEPWVLDRIGSLSKDYQSFVKVPLETQIKKYRVDYVLSEAVLSQKLLTQMPDLKMIASPGGYHIYSFRKDME
jgi:hypothetical protein